MSSCSPLPISNLVVLLWFIAPVFPQCDCVLCRFCFPSNKDFFIGNLPEICICGSSALIKQDMVQTSEMCCNWHMTHIYGYQSFWILVYFTSASITLALASSSVTPTLCTSYFTGPSYIILLCGLLLLPAWQLLSSCNKSHPAFVSTHSSLPALSSSPLLCKIFCFGCLTSGI